MRVLEICPGECGSLLLVILRDGYRTYGGNIHIVPDGVYPGACANRAAVPIAGNDKDIQVSGETLTPQATERARTAYTVKAVGIHIVRKAAGTTDA